MPSVVVDAAVVNFWPPIHDGFVMFVTYGLESAGLSFEHSQSPDASRYVIKNPTAGFEPLPERATVALPPVIWKTNGPEPCGRTTLIVRDCGLLPTLEVAVKPASSSRSFSKSDPCRLKRSSGEIFWVGCPPLLLPGTVELDEPPPPQPANARPAASATTRKARLCIRIPLGFSGAEMMLK